MSDRTLEEKITALEAELAEERLLRESLQQDLEAANQGLMSSLTSQKRFTDYLEALVRMRTTEASRARDEALAASRAKSEFLATMSHEIRTPMNAIVGFTQLLLKSDLSEKQRQQITNIEVSGRNLLQIINDILDFSKIEAGKLELDFVEFDLFELCEQLETLYSPQTKAKHLDFRVILDHKLPARVRGDSLRINQVLTNLISNALKFTGDGSITLMARLLATEGGHCEVEFSCQDSGVGILPEYQEKLFSAFTQADGSTTREFGGTGLGLSICKKLIEIMGGEIWVTSKFGHGSTFGFRLPLEIIDSARVAVKPTSSASEQVTFDGLRVLLVEDNEINQELALEMLAATGVTVEVAFNGLEALEKVKINRYDLVFMDMQMPLMDGMQATRLIRTELAREDLFIVAMTANASNEDRENCFAVGMNDFMPKPISLDAVMAMLAKATSRLEPAAQVASAADAPAVPTAVNVLDIDLALSRMGNREPLLRKMLTMFQDNYYNADETLADLLAAGKFKAAQDMTHSIKGVASNIAAEEFVAVCSELDDLLKHALSHESPLQSDVLAPLQEQFTASLGRLHGAISEYMLES